MYAFVLGVSGKTALTQKSVINNVWPEKFRSGKVTLLPNVATLKRACVLNPKRLLTVPAEHNIVIVLRER